jgi:hypothetical protein
MSVGRVVSSSTIRDLRFFRRLAALELEWQRDIDEWRSEEAGHLLPLRNAKQGEWNRNTPAVRLKDHSA